MPSTTRSNANAMMVSSSWPWNGAPTAIMAAMPSTADRYPAPLLHTRLTKIAFMALQCQLLLPKP